MRLFNELFAHRFVVLRRTIELVRQSMKLNFISLILVIICEVFWINVVLPGFKNSRFLWTSFNITWGFVDEKYIIEPWYQDSRDSIMFKKSIESSSHGKFFNFHLEVSYWSGMLFGIRNNVLKMPLTTALVSNSVSCFIRTFLNWFLILARTNNAPKLDHRSLAYPIECHQWNQ